MDHPKFGEFLPGFQVGWQLASGLTGSIHLVAACCVLCACRPSTDGPVGPQAKLPGCQAGRS